MSDSNGGSGDDTTEQTSSKTLLTVPLEIFEHIAWLSDPQDLLALRLLSKETGDKVLRTFKKIHFTERAFLLSNEDSLRTLLEIAQQKGFGASLETVILCTDEVPRRNHHSLENPYSRPKDLELPVMERMARQAREQQWSFLLEQQEQFWEREVNLLLLTSLFANLRCLNHAIEVEVTNQWVIQRIARESKILDSDVAKDSCRWMMRKSQSKSS